MTPCPLACERWHMRRPLPRARRRCRYIRQGGKAPARAMPIAYPRITDPCPRRCWGMTADLRARLMPAAARPVVRGQLSLWGEQGAAHG